MGGSRKEGSRTLGDQELGTGLLGSSGIRTRTRGGKMSPALEPDRSGFRPSVVTRPWAGHKPSECQFSHLQNGVIVGRVKTTYGKCLTVDKCLRALSEGRLWLLQLLLLV